MIFPSIRRSFQKRKYVIFLDIGEIFRMGVHESSVCDTGVYRFPNFHIFWQFPFKFPAIWTIFFNSQLHLTIPFCLFNSLILQYLPNVTHFPKSLPLSHIPKRCQLSLLSVHSFVFADIFYLNIYL